MLMLEDKLSAFIRKLKENGMPYQFGPDDEDTTWFVYDDNLSIDDAAGFAFHMEYWSDNGVSKYVVIPTDYEYVIKIPFNGRYIEECDYDEEEDCYGESEYVWEYNNIKDYCKIEYDVFQKAKEKHLDFLFAGIDIIDEVDGYKIYKQEKVYFNIRVNRSSESYEKSSKMCSNKSFHVDNGWLSKVIDYYGEYVADKLIDFLKEENLSDFHGGNCGYDKDGKPKLSDYSGWRD